VSLIVAVRTFIMLLCVRPRPHYCFVKITQNLSNCHISGVGYMFTCKKRRAV